MNDKVDTRVIRMEFDNKQFEKNVKQTNKSLDNLKHNLDFKGIGDSLDKVKLKVSALSVTMTTFVANISNRLINLGVTLVKSLSVDNISSGWAKFGEKTVAVATMMAQKIRIAGKEVEDLAERTAVVNEQLELLSWFSDETSYSFTDMTDNVGKFIAAGQDLDTSVKAMEGIATWAALSGQNAQTASRAMYQLAQAMGKGKVIRQDWMSIQNANMDTEEFRQTILETAVALGQLTKEGDKFVTKTGKRFTQSQFAEYLSEGWFTSEVLIKGLGKYSAAVDQIYELAEKHGLTATEVIEQYGDQLDEFGVKAFKAAQEARTFNDVLNSVKDAVTSKWMVTFENIFGSQEEAVKLWTKLSNELYDVFAESGNFRNSILSVWKEIGGRDDIFGDDGAFWNLYNAFKAIRDMLVEAWNIIFPLSEFEEENDQVKDIAINLKGITSTIRRVTERIKETIESSTAIRKSFELLFKVLKVGLVIIAGIKYALEPIVYVLFRTLEQALNRFTGLIDNIDGVLLTVARLFIRLREAIWSILEIINPSYILDTVFGILKNILDVVESFDIVNNLLNILEELFKGLRDGGGTVNNFIKIVTGLLSLIKIITNTVFTLAKILIKNLLPILLKIINAVSYIAGFVSGIVVEIVSSIFDIFNALDEFLSKGDSISSVWDTIKEFLNAIPKALVKVIPLLQGLIPIVEALLDAIISIPKILDNISIRLTGKGIIDNLSAFFNEFSTTISAFIKNLETDDPGKTGSFSSLINSLTIFFDGLREILKGLVASCQLLLVALGQSFKIIGAAIQKFADILIKIFTGRWMMLTKTERIIIQTVIIIGAIVAALYLLYAIFYRLLALVNPFGAVCDSIVDLIDKINMGSVVRKINSLAMSLLTVATAFYIFDKIKPELAYTIITLSAIIGSIAIILYFISSMTSSIETFGKSQVESVKEIKNARKKVKKTKGAFDELIRVLNAIANTMLKIAIVAMVFDRLKNPEETFGRIRTVLVVISLALVALTLILNSVSKSSNNFINNWKKDKSLIKVIGILYSIAGLLIVLSLTFRLFDGINEDTFTKGMEVLNFIFRSMIALMAVLTLSSLILSKSSINVSRTLSKLIESLSILSALFVSLSIMFIALANSLAILSEIPISNMVMSASVLSVMVAVMSGIVLVLTEQNKDNLKASLNTISLMMAMSVSLIILSESLLLLSNISFARIITSLLALEVLLWSLVAVSKILANTQNTSSILKLISNVVLLSIGIGVLSGAFYILANSLKSIAELPLENVFISAISLSLILGILSGTFVLINKMQTNLWKTIKNIIILSTIVSSLVKLSDSLLKIAKIPLKKIISSTLVYEVIMLSLIGIILILNKQKNSIIQSLKSLANLLLVSTSMVLLSESLVLLSKMPLLRAILALGIFATLVASLVLISKLISKLKATKEVLSFSAVLLILATSITSLAGSLFILSKVKFTSAAAGLILVVGALASLIALAAVAQSFEVTGTILGIAAAVALLGIGLSAMSVAMILPIKMLETLIEKGKDLGAMFVSIGEGLVVLITAIVVGVVKGLAVALVEGLKIILNGIYDLMEIVISRLINIMNTYMLPAMEAIINFLVGVLELVAANLTRVLEPLGAIVMTLATFLFGFITSNISVIVDSLVNILIAIINEIILLLPTLIDKVLVGFIVGLMDAIANTLQSAATQIKDTAVSFIKTIFDIFASIFGEEFKNIIKQDEINAFFDSIISYFKLLTKVYSDFMYGLMPIIEELLNMIVELWTNGAFKNLVKDLTNDLLKLFTALTPILKITTELTTIPLRLLVDIIKQIPLETIMGVIQPLAGFLSEFITVLLPPLVSLITSILKVTLQLTNIVLKILVPALMLIIDIVVLLFDTLVVQIKTLGTQIDLAIILFRSLMKLLSVLGDLFTAVFNGDIFNPDYIETFKDKNVNIIKEMLYSIKDLFKNYATGIFTLFDDVLKSLIKSITYGLVDSNNKIAKSIQQTVFGFLWKNFDEIGNWLIDKVAWLYEQMIIYGKKICDDIVNFAKDQGPIIISNIKKFFNEDLPKFFKVIIPNFFKNILKIIWEETDKVINQIYERIEKQFGISLPRSRLAEYGEKLIEGFISGIKDAANKVVKTTSDVCESIANAVKNFFGIHSPSKVFNRYGQYMMQGLGLGLEEGVEKENSVFNQILQNVLGSFKDLLTIGEDDVTIKVGMDISAVEQQTQNIRSLMSSVSNFEPSISGAYRVSADKAFREISRERSSAKSDVKPTASEIYNDNTTNNNVFNIKSSNPKEVADEIDKILQEKAINRKMAKGGI